MLDGNVALVTGAGRGIGRAIACALAGSGATVIINFNGSKEQALETVQMIEAAGGHAQALKCDVSDFQACGEMMETIISKYKHIDILVNNAGITRDDLIVRMNEQGFDEVINTNLKGAFNTIRHLTKQFLKQKSGKIINISSVSGIIGNAGQANYAASKAGLLGLTKSVARELASRGICVNAVAPGFIESDMSNAMSELAKQTIQSKIPMGHAGSVTDVANAVLFLASPEANYITGQVLSVDGGMAM